MTLSLTSFQDKIGALYRLAEQQKPIENRIYALWETVVGLITTMFEQTNQNGTLFSYPQPLLGGNQSGIRVTPDSGLYLTWIAVDDDNSDDSDENDSDDIDIDENDIDENDIDENDSDENDDVNDRISPILFCEIKSLNSKSMINLKVKFLNLSCRRRRLAHLGRGKGSSA